MEELNHNNALCFRHETDLHDEKMWIVDVEANRAEQVLHPGVVGIDSIDEVLVPATNYHLEEEQKCA